MKLKSPRRAARNRTQVLSRLRPWRPSSRRELARETGLSPATVSRITRDLVRRKVLTEADKPRPAQGRPERSLEINGSYGSVLGISLLYPAARFLVLDLRGELLRESSEPLDPDRGKSQVLGTLRRATQSIVRGLRPIGVGLALPGQWDPERGVSSLYPRVADWKDVPLRDLLGEWARCPATLIGYAPALALAEQARRVSHEPSNLVTVEVAENIAMGAIVNGGLLQGASGNAGELGHICIDPDGPACYCGARGCLETRATVSSVVQEAREASRGGSREASFDQVVRRARSGDPAAARILDRSARMLGLGLASALNLFNPELLVLNGRFFDAGDLVQGALRASILAHAVGSTVRRLSIESSSLGVRAAALGAGLVATKAAVQRL
ncbi:MAG TPA: ROK family transcriptional regulator [Planctomycetota bacterium]|nr:ROK family transcriptional regulator [Planctomycetota bacterium]